MLLLLLAACSGVDGDEGERLGENAEELNGALSGEGLLIRKNFVSATVDATDEVTRQLDTSRYSARPGADPDGGGDGFGAAVLFLSNFRSLYEFDGNEVTAYYYNRGDLGLGREMHCVDRFALDGQIACYVTNYAAGQDGSEFTFGQNPNVAFSNMAQGHAVATVAMVFRKYAQPSRENVMFLVYDQNEHYTYTAPLDRHGLSFANAFIAGGGEANPDSVQFGTPGVNFNNHIPTNCLNCHGGLYTPSSPANIVRNVNGAFFLPFDLDQFEFENQPGRTRADQQVAFRKLNQMVRKVALELGGVASPIVAQIDGWYGNQPPSETLSNNFDSSYVPPGWRGSRDVGVYRSVVRPSCRNCHITSITNTFEDAGVFRALSTLIAGRVSNHSMPHALQAQRNFWQSSQPLALENYFYDYGLSDAASAVHGAGPGRIVTLDPQLVVATVW